MAAPTTEIAAAEVIAAEQQRRRIEQAAALGGAVLYGSQVKVGQQLKVLVASGNKNQKVSSDLAAQLSTLIIEKRTQRFETVQVIHDQLGAGSETSKHLEKIHKELYDESFVGKGTVGGMQNTLRAYFTDANDLMNSFFGIVDNNNMLVTHYANKASKEEMATTVLLGRAMKLSSDHQQAFLERQFALTGEVDDSLMKQTLAYAKAIEGKTGISSKIIAENVGVMMKEISKFGAMTTDQMNKAAAHVAKLGIKMSSFSSMVGGFNSFESAAQNVAKLTQALGVQINVMDAVAMANENPEALLGMFKDQFDVANIDVSSLSQPMKRALADIFNLSDTNEVDKMFGAASDGLDEFLGKTDDALASVGSAEIDAALRNAEDDIRRLDILKDGIKTSAEAAVRHSLEVISEGMSVIELKATARAAKTILKVSKTASESMQSKVVKRILAETEDIVMATLTVTLNKVDEMITKFFSDKGLVAFMTNLAPLSEAQQLERDAAQQQVETTKQEATGLQALVAGRITDPKAYLPTLPTVPRPVKSTQYPTQEVILTPAEAARVDAVKDLLPDDGSGAGKVTTANQESFEAFLAGLDSFDADVSTIKRDNFTQVEIKKLRADYDAAVAAAKADGPGGLQISDINVVITVGDDGRLIASVKNE